MSLSPAVILYDANGVALAVENGVAIPANTRGLLVAGRETDGKARFVHVDANGTLATRLTDQHGKDAQLGAFGIFKVAQESMLANMRFDATTIPAEWDVTTTGTGGYSVEAGGTGVKLTTGASASSKVTFQTQRTHYYQAGRGQLIKLSTILGDSGVAGNIREWGYANATDGVLLRMDGTTLKLVVRANGAETIIPAASWDVPVTPDQYGHLWYLQFEWLGVGNIYLYYDEHIVHTVDFLGTSTEFSLGSPDLPLWYRNENTTNASNVYLKAGCVSVVTEGGTVISGQDDEGALRQVKVDSEGRLHALSTPATSSGLHYYAIFDRIAPAANKWMASLLNPTGSGIVARVRRVFVLDWQASGNQSSTLAQYLARTTAHSGGSEVTIRQFDSADAAPLLEAKTNCSSVTEDHIFRRFFASINAVNLANANWYNALAFAVNGVVFSADNDVSPIVLHEGQGLAIKNETSETSGSCSYIFEWVRTVQ